MKKPRKYKFWLSLVITLLLIISFLTSCDTSVSPETTASLSKPPIAISILYDASGSAKNIIDLENFDLFSDIITYMKSGAGGHLRFNFITSKCRFRGVELFIEPFNYSFNTPIESDFNSFYQYQDSLDVFYEKQGALLKKIKPMYDSINNIKINKFLSAFNRYKKLYKSRSLRNSSHIEKSIDRLFPFYQSAVPNCRNFLCIFSDGVSHSGFKLNTKTFKELNIKTFIIGLDRFNSRGNWKLIPYTEATSFDTVIHHLLNNY